MDKSKCNEESKTNLLGDLVRIGGKHPFSAIRDLYGYEKFTTEYQLRKALMQLERDGMIATDFKGYNRYGYTRYFATDAGKKRIESLNEAREAFKKWETKTQKAE